MHVRPGQAVELNFRNGGKVVVHVPRGYRAVYTPTGFQGGGPIGPAGDGRSYPFPLFVSEESSNWDAAYRHNRPFATPPPYETRLSPTEEQQFQKWVADNHLTVDKTYDWRGLWQQTGGKKPRDFQPDTYKTPYDPTFSHESKYATKDNPFYWQNPATLIDTRTSQVVFFGPEHYKSPEEPGEYGAPPPSVAPWDVPDQPPPRSLRGRIQQRGQS